MANMSIDVAGLPMSQALLTQSKRTKCDKKADRVNAVKKYKGYREIRLYLY